MRGSRRKALAAAAAAATILASTSVFAEPVVAPAAVRVEVHADVQDQRFVPLLVEHLARILAPPIEQGHFELDLAPFESPLPKVFPANAQPLLIRIAEGVLARGAQAKTHVIVIEGDIRLPPARFNLAASMGSPQAPARITIVSLARLRSLSADGRDPKPALTAQRVFKLTAKNVARLAGYPGEAGRCLFAFPSNAADLDATPESFCEPDLGVLVRAGIARRETDTMRSR